MPPAISDEETSEVETTRQTSARSGRRKSDGVKYDYVGPDLPEEDEDMVEAVEATNGDAKEEDVKDAEEEDEDGEDSEEPEEYVVEKILAHRWEKATQELKFEVKWEGYEKKADRTWEPEENITHTAVFHEYCDGHGGLEKMIEEAQQGVKSKKRGRTDTDTPTSTTKRSRKNGDHPRESTPPKAAAWKPPLGSWEEEIADLDACEDEQTGQLMVFLTWKNGQKTQHETKVVYKRCPQKMLQFYERHVRIIKRDADEGEDAVY